MFGTESLFKKGVKFLFKRYLGRLLQAEVDLEQLSVQLGSRTLELHTLLLDTDYLNEKLASEHWEVTAGYVGCLRINIPLTSLYSEPCSLDVDDVVITLVPKAQSSTAAHNQGSASFSDAAAAGSAGDAATGAESSALQMGIMEGRQAIANSIDSLLQRLKVTASRVTVRLEVPCQQTVALVVVRLDHLCYSAGTATAPAASLQKDITFAGLTAELYSNAEDDSAPEQPEVTSSDVTTSTSALQGDELEKAGQSDGDVLVQDSRHIIICSRDGAGASGQMQLTLTQSHSDNPKPSIKAALTMQPLQVQLHAEHLLLLMRLGSIFSAAAESSQALSTQAGHPTQGEHWGSRSLVESVMLPDTLGMAQQVMSASGQPAGNALDMAASADSFADYSDARSSMGSMYSSVSSYLSTAASTLRSSEAFGASSARRQQSEAAAARQPAFELSVRTEELSLVLRYATDQMSVPCSYGPRFSAECTHLHATVQVSGQGISDVTVRLASLEAAEHIPCSGSSDADCRSLALAQEGLRFRSGQFYVVWAHNTLVNPACQRDAPHLFLDPLIESIAPSTHQQAPSSHPGENAAAASSAASPAASPQRTAVTKAIHSILHDLQHLNKAEHNSPSRSIGSQRRHQNQHRKAAAAFRLAVSAPHVTVVMLLPPAQQGVQPLHGYTHLALDLSSVQQEEGPKTPMLIVEPDLRQAAHHLRAAFGWARVYLIGSPYPEDIAFAEFVSSPATAKCILDAWDHGRGCSIATHGTSTADAADAEMRRLRLQETILATSTAHVSMHARSAQLQLSQSAVAALCHLSDSFAQWRAEVTEAALIASGGNGLPPAAQIVFELEACVQVGPSASNAAPEPASDESAVQSFDLRIAEMRLFSGAGLGGSASASALWIHARDLALSESPAGACVLMTPEQPSNAALHFTKVSRAKLKDSALRYEPPLHELPARDDPTAQALCAVLWIGRAQVNLPHSPAEMSVLMGNISLWCCQGACPWELSTPAAVAQARLMHCGYTCLAQERGLRLTIHTSAAGALEIDLWTEGLRSPGMTHAPLQRTVSNGGLSNGGQVRVMEGVQENAFGRHGTHARPEAPVQCSVCVDGGWYDARDADFGPSGEPPQPSTDLLEHYFNVTLEGFEDAALLAIEEPDVDDSELEQQGIWYDDSGEEERPPGETNPPYSLDDDWMTIGKDPLHSVQEGLPLALKPLDMQHDFRFTLHNASACISLCSDPDASEDLTPTRSPRVQLNLHGVSFRAFEVDLETVCPSVQGSTQEYRLLLALQPLRVRLNQNVFKFLRGLVETLTASADGSSAEAVAASDEPDPSTAGQGAYFQSALCGTVVGGYTANLCKRDQIMRIFNGLRPLRALSRVGLAARPLLLILFKWLFQKQPEEDAGRAAVPLSRQLQRSTAELAKAILVEMLGLGAYGLGGIQAILQGAQGSHTSPTDMSDGLRQAADHLNSALGTGPPSLQEPPSHSARQAAAQSAAPTGYGVAAFRAIRAAPGVILKPLGAGVAAARCTVLGARNSMDPARRSDT
ncbi:hypothetical protein WJX73_002535 [Symbiochloris irregularis]|uniref:Autophagy-related protein 2 n=1 Tax=Symbiochloris irregularis TaxID=706552 RepID=A0AAW1NKH2_9CHLO